MTTGNQLPQFTLNRSVLLHPLSLFISVWCGVAFLYSLHLSDLLLFSDEDVRSAIEKIVLPYTLSAVVVIAICGMLSRAFPVSDKRPNSTAFLERRLTVLFRFWLVATCFEIAVSGGVPLLWVLRGSSKTYFDFGIPSVHGLLNSLLQAVAITRVAMFAMTRERKHLRIPAFVLAWSVLVITRNMMIVTLFESGIVVLSFRRIRTAILVRLGAAAMILILAFGLIGDMRSGADSFRTLAQPTETYPEWMPSGVLWGYIYLTTPINNLLHTIRTVPVAHDVLFPNTSALLFPSVFRILIYGSQYSEAESGNLVTQAFNVSTAFTSPYQDWGNAGMALYSIFIGAVAMLYWRRRGLRDALIYSVLGQCLILTVFFNHFFYLPVITQVVWLYLIFAKRRIRFGRTRAFAPQLALPAADPT